VTVTVVVPTFNEGPNVRALTERLCAAFGVLPGDGRASGALHGPEGGPAPVGVPDLAEILFVDDSTDDTPELIREVAATAPVPVRLLHREKAEGGLSGAVVAGLRTVTTEWAVVMDGDLQHPPELVPALVTRGRESGLDIVVASRYTGDGDAGGLDGWWRHGVSIASALLARSMFPVRLRNVTDPLTGFFAARVDRLDLDALHPRGFKILLELLARNTLAVGEEPFVFGERFAGHSKATFRTGLRYLEQLAALRFGRMSRFAIIGGLGAVLNILILWALTGTGMHYVVAAVISAVVTILTNFLLQERFVFRDLRNEGRGVWSRFAHSFAFNGTEAAIRLPVLWWLVEFTGMWPVLVQAVTLVVAFLLRFVFHVQVVYKPRRTQPAIGVTPPLGADRADERVQ
jgi:dolichol-phosphate mannosyltransferase